MGRTAHDPVIGVVEVWHEDEGWGVLRTPDALSVFCHFSQVEGEGYRTLVQGSSVWFDYETPGQDGCDGRVLTAARAGSADPTRPLGTNTTAEDPSAAYQSTLTIKLDGP